MRSHIRHPTERYRFGSTTVFDEPPGAASVPDGVSPCGLSAGAPPEPVASIWPVRPCGCIWPLVSGETVRPVLCGESVGWVWAGWVWANAVPAQNARQTAASAMRMESSQVMFPSPTNDEALRSRRPNAFAAGAEAWVRPRWRGRSCYCFRRDFIESSNAVAALSHRR